MSTPAEKPTSKFYTVAHKARGDKGDDGPLWLVPDGTTIQSKSWEKTSTLKPPMPPDELVEIYRKSSEIPKNARARGQNVAGFGWTLDPVLDFDDPKLPSKARMYIYLDRLSQWRQELARAAQAAQKATRKEEKLAAAEEIKRISKEPPSEPSDAEVETEIAGWQKRADMEHALLTIRLENFCYEVPFQELIKRTEINRGGLAYCAWEIIRDATATPIRAKLLEPMYLRASEEEEIPIAVPWLRKTSKVTYEHIMVERRFRKWYVQQGEIKLWYKEFGDPRTISQTTGIIYPDFEAFEVAKEEARQETRDAKEAMEVLVWSEYSPGAAPYGMPVWHGHSLDVETSRISKEFDYDELAHGKMPRGAFSIVDADIESPIREGFLKFLREGGIGNRNRVAVMEMVTSSMQSIAGAGRAMFDFIDFSKAQHDDATHLKLKEVADSGVAQDFGNPPVLLGASKDVQNRSVAEMSQQVAEEQTYAALRQLWDHAINQHLVRPWGFRFWKFKLNAPRLQQTEVVGNLIKILVDAHVLTPAQAVPVAAQLLGITVLGEPADWQKVPPKVAQAGMTKDFLETPDDPMTVADESGKTTPKPTAEAEAATGLLEQLGMLVDGFTDGVAQKMRKRLGFAREQETPEEDELGDFWPMG